MADRDCVIEVAGKSGVSAEAARELLNRLEAKASLRGERGTAAFDSALANLRYDEELGVKASILREKRDTAITLQKRAGNEAKLDRLEESGQSRYQALRSLIGGTISKYAETRNSVSLQRVTNHQKYVAAFAARLDKQGVRAIFSDKSFERDNADYFSYLNTKDKSKTPEPNVSQQSKTVAQEVKNITDALRAERNKNGAYIADLDKFAGVQSHDSWKITKAGYDKWSQDIKPLIDRDNLFRNLESQLKSRATDDFIKQDADTQKFLAPTEENFDKITKYIYDRMEKGDQYNDVSSTNLGARISVSRLIPFKDTDSWLSYNRKYGAGGWSDSVLHQLDKGSRDLTMLQAFGPKPADAWNKLTNGVSRDEKRALDNIYHNVDGSVNNPMNPTIAQLGNTLRTYNVVTKLGKAIFAHMATDPLTMTIEGQRQGMGFAKSFGNTIRTLTNFLSFGALEDKTASKLMQTGFGIGNEGMVGQMLAHSGEGLPGMGTKMTRLMLKLNAEQPWIDMRNRNYAAMMSGMLGEGRDLKFQQLPGGLATMLKRYGIDSQRWDIVRKAAAQQEDGRYHIMPDQIEAISTEKMRSYMPGKFSDRQVEQARSQLADSYRGFVIDRSSYFAGVNPDDVDRAIALQGTNPGTWSGLAARSLLQFKQFPLAGLRKVWGESIKGAETPDYAQMAQIVGGAFLTGYSAYASRSYLEGKVPASPLDPKTAAQAWVRGAGGLYGDMLIQGVDHWGDAGGFLKSNLGPTIGTAADLYEIAARGTKEGKISNGDFKKLVGDGVPYSGLFWLKPALDYTVLNSIQEKIRPGYISRLNNAMTKQGRSLVMNGPLSASNRSIGDKQ